ncbi:hypothetical protein SLEP1_g6452 [Rubroshorea leprosula]|uniref:FLZ-type domain-containing protein n=1 Tax=Rubroshorea leprosula TaxID=152421 RepID=A0AAV5HV90_9ROSI|nr:hypothetical protein SLEP1_g6452 [Rubroshorea leprosula]
MLLKFKTPSSDTEKKRRDDVGLRILTQISHGKPINVVIKSALKKVNPPPAAAAAATPESCFLKSCHLCNKKLSLDKEVYMYRGDQGFCSIGCRDRQIVMDEMRKLEASTKQMVQSRRRCSATDRQETRRLLEELRHQHKPPPNQNKMHWTIV